MDLAARLSALHDRLQHRDAPHGFILEQIELLEMEKQMIEILERLKTMGELLMWTSSYDDKSWNFQFKFNSDGQRIEMTASGASPEEAVDELWALVRPVIELPKIKRLLQPAIEAKP